MSSMVSEVVVVGAGVVGLAVAQQLARAGREVLVLERIEKAKLLIYWHNKTLRSQYVYRYVEP